MSLIEALKTSNAVVQYQKREYLSYSTLLTFVRCPRKYFYQKCGVISNEEPVALHYGTAMHKAVSVAMTKGLDAAVAAFDSLWDESKSDEKRSAKRARAQLSHFVKTHEGNRSIYQLLDPPESSIELTEDVSDHEIPFVIDVGLPIPIAGRIDGWCRHRDNGSMWAYEFKTTSRLTSSLFDSLELNPQILTYALVTRTVTGSDIKGVMLEAMLIDKSKVDNVVMPVPVPEHLLDDAVWWLRYYGEMLLACEESGEFPKNFAGCTSYPLFYMPGSSCEFMNLCRVQDWTQMLPYYSVKPEHRMFNVTIGETNATKLSS